MSKSLHPRAMDLRIWAAKLERNLLTPDEAQYIATLLRRVAAGESIDEVLDVKRVAHRPTKNFIHHYVEQVYGLTQPTHDGKPGMSVTDAIHKVAYACGVTVETVKSSLYSPAGRAHRKTVKQAMRGPVE